MLKRCNPFTVVTNFLRQLIQLQILNSMNNFKLHQWFLWHQNPLRIKTMKAEQIIETLKNIRTFNFCRSWKLTSNISLNKFVKNNTVWQKTKLIIIKYDNTCMIPLSKRKYLTYLKISILLFVYIVKDKKCITSHINIIIWSFSIYWYHVAE